MLRRNNRELARRPTWRGSMAFLCLEGEVLGMEVTEVQDTKQLHDENARLQNLDKEALSVGDSNLLKLHICRSALNVLN